MRGPAGLPRGLWRVVCGLILASFALAVAGEPNGISAVTVTLAELFLLSLLLPDLLSFTFTV